MILKRESTTRNEIEKTKRILRSQMKEHNLEAARETAYEGLRTVLKAPRSPLSDRDTAWFRLRQLEIEYERLAQQEKHGNPPTIKEAFALRTRLVNFVNYFNQYDDLINDAENLMESTEELRVC